MSSEIPSDDVNSKQRNEEEEEEDRQDTIQIKQIEASVKRLRQQRYQVEQLKQDSLEKDTKIERLQAELLLERQQKNRITSPSNNTNNHDNNNNNNNNISSSPLQSDSLTMQDIMVLTSPDNSNHDKNNSNNAIDTSSPSNEKLVTNDNSAITNRYAGIPKLIARFREEVQTLQQEKRVLNEQVKLLKKQQEASHHEYKKTIETHKELEISLRREIELSENERKAENKIFTDKFTELEKQFAESRMAAMSVANEKEQIGVELKSAILSMEDAQNAQQLRAKQLEEQVTKLTYHKQDSDNKLKEVMKSSHEYIDIVHKLEMDKNNLMKENETLKALNEDLKLKINHASETIDFSNTEMEKQRKLMIDMVDELKSETQKREHAEKVMEDSEQEIRMYISTHPLYIYIYINIFLTL